MRKIFGWLGAFILGLIGARIGSRIHGPGVALILGAIGAGIGLYYGRKLFDQWLG